MSKPIVKVAQTFRWEMGHRLPYHTSGCQNFHGHSYRMIVEICGYPQDNGMVIDFYDIEDVVNPLIDEVDHAFMCSNDDELTRTFLIQSGLKAVFVDFYSTAENIALYFLKKIQERLTYPNITRLAVRVYETEKEFAEVTVDFPSAT